MRQHGDSCADPAAECDVEAQEDSAAFVLGDSPGSIRDGRHFARSRLLRAGADTLVDDAALIATELLANARQHAQPPVILRVFATPTTARIEVEDGSPRAPVRTLASTQNMTGRGLALVDKLATAWNFDRVPSGGKVVWAELVAGAGERHDADADVDALVASWEDEPETTEHRFTVILGDVPTSLLVDAKAHIDNLVREFSLAAAGSQASGVAIPPHLARLIHTVVHGFEDARAAIKRQAIAAAQHGRPRTSLSLYLPLSAADAGEAYLAALDEADSYARAARLLTLETPPEHRLFRRWYVEAVIDQLRRAARGESVVPPVPFEERLLAEVRRLHATAKATSRAARLQRLTSALAKARTPEDVAAVVVSEGVEALDASGGSLLVPAEDGEHLAVPGAVGYGEGLVDLLRAERADAQLPAAVALRTGVPVWIESQTARDQMFPELRGLEPETVSMCAVPLELAGRRLGALRFSFSASRLFDDEERSFVLALAAQTAQTLERTERYVAERAAAVQLQRALLPRALETVAGWEIAAHYSPAGDQQVGGDWFDIIPLPDGRVVAVVGDVVGRGIEAAAAMAQMRSTLRAYVALDPDPAMVMSRIDELFEREALSQLVTVLYMLAETGTGRVHICNAGHLLPLSLPPDGTGERLVIEPSTPFGAGGDTRTATTIDLPEGFALVAVTDGLVERRGEDIDEGIDRLLGHPQVNASGTAEAIVRHIVNAAAADRVHDDDVTVLVLRRRTPH